MHIDILTIAIRFFLSGYAVSAIQNYYNDKLIVIENSLIDPWILSVNENHCKKAILSISLTEFRKYEIQ